jgi:uncharacterized protein YdeI (YjbR/CyaY-like superfamily)
VNPLDVSRAFEIDTADALDAWLERNAAAEREVVVSIVKKATGRATVTLLELQEVALCHGWVDTQTKRIDDERYAIRFVPRTARSTWGPKNRAMARRMLESGRVRPHGLATLPEDL